MNISKFAGEATNVLTLPNILVAFVIGKIFKRTGDNKTKKSILTKMYKSHSM